MAEIGKEEAKNKIITTEVEYRMAEAEKATLHADVATILAEILTKGLAKIRLEVEQAEITKGYEWLTLYLQDMLDQWDKKLLAVNFQADSEETIGKELTALVAAKKAAEDLVITKITIGRGFVGF